MWVYKHLWIPVNKRLLRAHSPSFEDDARLAFNFKEMIESRHLPSQTQRKQERSSETGLFFDSPCVHVRLCGGLQLTEEWQSASLGYWEDHMPLSTPAGCVGGGLASPRIGSESLSPGSQAGRRRVSREKDKSCLRQKTETILFKIRGFIQSTQISEITGTQGDLQKSSSNSVSFYKNEF